MADYSYRTPLKLPVRYTLESDTHIENEFLFGLYEFIFTGRKKPALINYYIRAARAHYPNHIIDSVPQKKLSHDQTTAYFCFAFVNELPTEKIKSPADFHPRDEIFYALLEMKYFTFLLVPLFYFICAFSMLIGYRVKDGKLQPKLSGELLWVLRYETMMSDRSLCIVAWPMKYIIKLGAYIRFGGVKQMVFKYFYNDMNHPILKNWDYKL